MSAALPIVLVPGLACSLRLFAPQLPLLWQWGPVTVAAPRGAASIAELARAILQDAPPRFVLMGLSMGGYLAFEMLRQAPERVAALAVLNSSARADSVEASDNRQRMMTLARQGRLALAIELSFPRSVHPDRASDAGLRQLVQQMAQETGLPAYLQQQSAILQRIDSRPSLAHIACPSLVLVGDSDQLTPPALAEEIHASIAGSQLHVLPRCGHLSTLECPDQVNAVLERWLTDLAPGLLRLPEPGPRS